MTAPMTIRASIRSDDGRYDVTFDATPYFETALDEGRLSDVINGLARIDYGRDYEADAVAYGVVDHNADVSRVIKYCEFETERANRLGLDTWVGFEVEVNRDDVVRWVEAHAPEMAKAI